MGLHFSPTRANAGNMKEEIIFLSGLIIGGLVTAVGAGRFDLLLALVIGMVIGMIFIIGFQSFLKWLAKRRPTQ